MTRINTENYGTENTAARVILQVMKPKLLQTIKFSSFCDKEKTEAL